MAVTINLDDLQIYKRLDPEDMLRRIHEFASQCRMAWDAAMQLPMPEHYRNINKVVICGMGGSAIGGDLLSTLAAPESPVPIFVFRGYELPSYVDDRTLVIVSSYSGNTEETLSCFEQSLKTGGRNIAITTGGKLKARAEEKKVPLFVFDYDAQPRAALAFGFLPAMCFLQRLGLLKDRTADVRETVNVLDRLSASLNEKVPTPGNAAKQLAGELYGQLAVIYGAEIVSEVAHRWKTQLNENGKSWAFYEVFPELDHNAVVGYQFPAALAKKIAVVMLRSSQLSERVKLRYEVTARLLDRAGVTYRCCDGVGESPLSQMLSLILLGDYTSYYLALLNGTNPTSIEAIDYLKTELAKHAR